MSDDHDRRLADIEKRLARLEASVWPLATEYAAVVAPSKAVNVGEQWCQCGRDVCRAPDCPSHKPDPLGR
jgi:hypothetical protein